MNRSMLVRCRLCVLDRHGTEDAIRYVELFSRFSTRQNFPCHVSTKQVDPVFIFYATVRCSDYQLPCLSVDTMVNRKALKSACRLNVELASLSVKLRVVVSERNNFLGWFMYFIYLYIQELCKVSNSVWKQTMKESEIEILWRTEKSVVSAMCGVQLKDWKRAQDMIFGFNWFIDQFVEANTVDMVMCSGERIVMSWVLHWTFGLKVNVDMEEAGWERNHEGWVEQGRCILFGVKTEFKIKMDYCYYYMIYSFFLYFIIFDMLCSSFVSWKWLSFFFNLMCYLYSHWWSVVK